MFLSALSLAHVKFGRFSQLISVIRHSSSADSCVVLLLQNIRDLGVAEWLISDAGLKLCFLFDLYNSFYDFLFVLAEKLERQNPLWSFQASVFEYAADGGFMLPHFSGNLSLA